MSIDLILSILTLTGALVWTIILAALLLASYYLARRLIRAVWMTVLFHRDARARGTTANFSRARLIGAYAKGIWREIFRSQYQHITLHSGRTVAFWPWRSPHPED